MKLSHFLPISAVIAGCSSINPVPQKASLPVAKSSPSVTQSIDDCIAGVEVILEHPYGDGLTLQIERADSCTDPLGEFLHRKKIQRRGQIVFAPTAKLPAGVRQRTLDVLVTRGENGEQAVLVGGKPLLGKQKETLLLRIDELDKDGPLERMR